MKVLIAYDGSDCADAALDDLCRAGLPEVGEFLVLSIAEITSRLGDVGILTASPGYYFPNDPRVENLNDRQLEQARRIAAIAVARVRVAFPKWRITTEALVDLPQSAIVQKAADWKPNLIVMGSHGRSGFKRLALGSVSQYVLNHTTCSVRIGRRHLGAMDQPIRLLIGTDGSPNGTTALGCVGARSWPSGTEVKVVGVVDPRSWIMASATGEPGSICMPEIEEELRKRACNVTAQGERDLAKSCLIASTQVCSGNPGQVLVAEAEQWGADCVFIGARGLKMLGRLFLGSVSSAVALHAHCSVEVVREPRLSNQYCKEIFKNEAESGSTNAADNCCSHNPVDAHN